MTRSKSNKSNSKSFDGMSHPSKQDSNVRADETNLLKELTQSISTLTYEESIAKLDSILEDLQNESIPIEDLQRYYLQGKVCLEHCEKLLDVIEQEIVEIDPDKMN